MAIATWLLQAWMVQWPSTFIRGALVAYRTCTKTPFHSLSINLFRKIQTLSMTDVLP